jgi:hypothetical protein
MIRFGTDQSAEAAGSGSGSKTSSIAPHSEPSRSFSTSTA